MSNTKKLLLGFSALVLIGLGAAGATLLASHSKKTTQATSKPTTGANTATAPASQSKLTACTSGTTQTIANSSYLVGTDIGAGNYKIVSQAAGTDWTNINVYNSKAEYDKQGDPTNEQGVANTSLSPQNGVATNIKLSNGQFMVVDADPAVFTCE